MPALQTEVGEEAAIESVQPAEFDGFTTRSFWDDVPSVPVTAWQLKPDVAEESATDGLVTDVPVELTMSVERVPDGL